jgi:hypothetical protein
MSLNVIQKWFRSEKQDFDEGLLILKKHAPGHKYWHLKDCFRKNAYNEGKLRQALRELEYKIGAPDKPEEELRSMLTREERFAIATDLRTPPEQAAKKLYPDEVSDAMLKRRTLANLRDKLANSLVSITDQVKRAEARQQIEDLHAEIQQYNDIVGTWDREQKVLKPTPPPREPGLSHVEKKAIEREQKKDETPLFQQLANARSNRSKKLALLKKWREKEGYDPEKRAQKIEKYKDETEKWDNEVKRLETLINEQKEKQEA